MSSPRSPAPSKVPRAAESELHLHDKPPQGTQDSVQQTGPKLRTRLSSSDPLAASVVPISHSLREDRTAGGGGGLLLRPASLALGPSHSGAGCGRLPARRLTPRPLPVMDTCADFPTPPPKAQTGARVLKSKTSAPWFNPEAPPAPELSVTNRVTLSDRDTT